MSDPYEKRPFGIFPPAHSREVDEILAAPGNVDRVDFLNVLPWAWARFPLSSAYQAQNRINQSENARQAAQPRQTTIAQTSPQIIRENDIPTMDELRRLATAKNWEALDNWRQQIRSALYRNRGFFDFDYDATTPSGITPGFRPGAKFEKTDFGKSLIEALAFINKTYEDRRSARVASDRELAGMTEVPEPPEDDYNKDVVKWYYDMLLHYAQVSKRLEAGVMDDPSPSGYYYNAYIAHDNKINNLLSRLANEANTEGRNIPTQLRLYGNDASQGALRWVIDFSKALGLNLGGRR